MQLHPAEPGTSVGHCVQSLASGFIGLDFAKDVGDMSKLRKQELPDGHQDYLDFAKRMRLGDRVLVIAHHFPFALVKVAGDYNYISRTEPELGIWFRHFRRVENVRYYSDFKTNVSSWEQLRMTDAISILNDSEGKSYRLIKQWLSEGEPSASTDAR
jgi:hypothetical protein